MCLQAKGGHKRDSFDFGSSAAGSAIGVGLAALIGMGRKACEGGGLAAGERTELGMRAMRAEAVF